MQAPGTQESAPQGDPGSLANLHPIVLPDPVPVWPLAPGWYMLLALLLAAAAWAGACWWRHRRAQQYRRQALAELEGLDEAGAIPGLLKRAALSVFPRQEVAQLTGADWHRFLDRSAGRPLFEGETGLLLDRASYENGTLDADQGERLRTAAGAWLKEHRVDEPRP